MAPAVKEPTVWRNATGVVRAPWKVAVFGVAVAVTAVAAGGLALGVLAGSPLGTLARVARIPLDQIASLGAMLAATWIATRVLVGDGRGAWAYSALGKGAWAPARVAVAAFAGVWVVAMPIGLMLLARIMGMEPATAADSWAMTAWAAFALMVPAALAEELLFRGYAFTAICESSGDWAAIGVTSVLFGAAHLFNPDPSVVSTVAVMAAGVFLSIVRVTTGSLVAAWTAHVGINFAQAVFFHAPVSGIALGTPGYRLTEKGPAWLTGGGWGPEGGAAVVGGMTVASFLYLWWRRWRDARTAASSTTIP